MRTKAFYGGERCAHCGLAFAKTVPGQRFCGSKCKDKYHSSGNRPARAAEPLKPVEAACKSCGKRFSRIDRGQVTKLYCTEACRADARKTPVGTRECSRCGQQFPVFGRQKMCVPCRQVASVKKKACQICGKGFETLTDSQRHCDPCRALDNETQAMIRERISVRPGQAYTMAEIVARNLEAGPLEGCPRCKRREGHDVWCPIGGEP